MNGVTPGSHKFFDIIELRKAYERGENITQLMREKSGLSHNSSEIIEVAYDLQAGSYVDYARNNPDALNRYTTETGAILGSHLAGDDQLLDIGTGEMTTLCALLKAMPDWQGDTFAFDISWSRIRTGQNYVEAEYPALRARIKPFVADLAAIPLRDKSVDVVTSSHALEPNGGRLPELLSELFRITRRKLVLFEPSYELGNEAARERMARLGYIRDMQGAVEGLGGTFVSASLINNIARVENPTACYVIEPPKRTGTALVSNTGFSVPGTDHPLTLHEGFYHSSATGLGFPVVDSIPVLKRENAILMTAL
ncbi:MAG: class I SAM-dependent methyltransferase [Pseudomonadota bacterium]